MKANNTGRPEPSCIKPRWRCGTNGSGLRNCGAHCRWTRLWKTISSISEDGLLYHFYSASAIMAENEYRGLDLFTPVWNLLDLTPEGRGDWLPSVRYDE